MSNQDIRWEQRFSNFSKALRKLEDAVLYIEENNSDEKPSAGSADKGGTLSELIKQGLIQAFEFTHELAWNMLKDYASYQGNSEIGGSRDATREAFSLGIISDGEIWMEMIKSRNKTSHTYNEETANEIFTKIIDDFLPAFISLRDKMEVIRRGKQGDIFDN